jgi:hypothetical protein
VQAQLLRELALKQTLDAINREGVRDQRHKPAATCNLLVQIDALLAHGIFSEAMSPTNND